MSVSGASEAPTCQSSAALAPEAPEALDLRLAVPALCSWLAAAWAVGRQGEDGGRAVVITAAACLVCGAGLVVPVTRFRPPRHRRDPRAGAQDAGDLAAGSPAATALVTLVAVSAVLTIAGAHLWVRTRDPVHDAVVSARRVEVIATVTEQPRARASTHGATVMVRLRAATVDGNPSRAEIRVIGGAPWMKVPLGAQVRLRTRLGASQPGGREQALVWRDAVPQVVSPPGGLLAAVGRVRAGLAAAAEGVGPSGAAPLVTGIVLGDDHALPADLRDDMRVLSLSHLTAVSGQHVALVIGMVLAVLGPVPRRLRAWAGSVVLVGLVVLVGPAGSVLRAAAMGTVVLIGVALGRRSASVPALCAAVVLLLLVDPWQARDYGFILSVTATAGILLGQRLVQVRLGQHLPGWLAAAIALPLVAQAACAPVLILLRPSVPLWAVPANVLAAPVVPVVTVAGLAAALVSPVWPWVAHVLVLPAVAGCSWLVHLSQRIARFPGADLTWPDGVGGALALAVVEAVCLLVCSSSLRRRLTGLAWGQGRRGRLGP